MFRIEHAVIGISFSVTLKAHTALNVFIFFKSARTATPATARNYYCKFAVHGIVPGNFFFEMPFFMTILTQCN